MGLLKAGTGALGGVMADQWREFFYCDAMEENVLITKGKKRSGKRSSNTKGEDNVISNGSLIAVNDGQCMIIVDQGKVVEICAEPGEFVYDNSTEASIFYGGLGEGIKRSFFEIGKRFSFGGEPGKDQRIYYINTKEIPGNNYGTPAPVPFRVVDQNVGLDIDIAISCHGEYSYKISDPILFYTNVTGNVSDEYTRDRIDGQLKTELLTALQPAFGRISAMGIRYSALPGHTKEIAEALNEELSKEWRELRGVEVVSFGIKMIKASEEDEAMIKELQRNAAFRNPTMAAAHMVAAQADAMKDAAKNEAGAMTGFMGFGMAQNAGTNANIQSLFEMGQNAPQQTSPQTAQPQPAPSQSGSWKCACGADNAGKFCSECGAAKPEEISWKCTCGADNEGKFCSNCGTPRPAGTFKCDKCGWIPEDSANPPKFCPECGDPFNNADRK